MFGAAPPTSRARLEGLKASMSTDDLRKELGRRELSTQDNKGELAARLEEHLGVEGLGYRP